MSPSPENTFRAATYNVRVDAGLREPELAWPARLPRLAKVIGSIDPDILGTQEGLAHQVFDLAANLPKHRWLGSGRDGGQQGEFMAIYYRESRFKVMECGDFWLSDTPHLPSATWGNRYRRMVSWAILRDLGGSRDVLVLNTHLDHESENAREKSAAQLLHFITDRFATLPCVLLGDFNAVARDSRTHTMLTMQDAFRDGWDEAPVHPGDPQLDTFNDFQPPRRQGKRIDWILLRGLVRARTAGISSESEITLHASDHLPVWADVAWT